MEEHDELLLNTDEYIIWHVLLQQTSANTAFPVANVTGRLHLPC